MEIIIKKRKSGLDSILDLNFDGFRQEVELLTEKQEKRIERQIKSGSLNELKEGMVLFRKLFYKKFVGRKQFCKKYNVSWEDFTQQSIWFINIEWMDIDEFSFVSDYFMCELRNEYTELTWTSYSTYYDNKKNCKSVRKSKRSLDDFLIDTTTGMIMNSNEIKLELDKITEELTEKLKVAIKNEKADTVKKMKEDIKKYGITRTDLSTAFKKKRKVKVK